MYYNFLIYNTDVFIRVGENMEKLSEEIIYLRNKVIDEQIKNTKLIEENIKLANKNTITMTIKLEGFEEANKQLDILIGKCKELNKVNTTCSINNNFFVSSNSNIDDIAKEISEKLRLCVMKND